MASIKMIKNSLQPANLLQELNRQRKRNQLCEVKLVVENEIFHAHQCVLAASSTYFNKLFLIENPNLEDEIEVALKNVTALGMRDVLNYIYGDDIYVSEETVEELLKVTLALSVKDLTNDVLKYMISILVPGNCLRMLHIARRNKTTRFYRAVKKFICENLDAVSGQDAFYFLPISEMEKIVASDDIKVESETHLYEIILTWVKFDLETRRKHFPSLLKHVRLQLVPQDYLIDVISAQDLVKEFISCRDLVQAALLFHLRPEKCRPQAKRLHIDEDCGTTIIATEKHIMSFSEDELSIECQIRVGIRGQVSVVDGMNVFLCGGVTDCVVGDVVQYKDQKFVSLPSLAIPRFGPGAVSCQGKLYVFGGSTASSRLEGKFTDKVETLDRVIGEWSVISQAPTKRSHLCCALLDGLIYLMGGYIKTSLSEDDTETTITTTTEIYCPSSNGWSPGPNMNKGRASFCAQTFRQQIFVFGGNTSGGNTVETFHALDFFWTNIKTELPCSYGRLFCGKISDTICVTSEMLPNTIWTCNIFDEEWEWKKTKNNTPIFPVTPKKEKAPNVVLRSSVEPGEKSGRPKHPEHEQAMYFTNGGEVITFKSEVATRTKIPHFSSSPFRYASACRNGAITICGGMRDHNIASDVFEFSEGKWTRLSSMQSYRIPACAIWAQEFLFVFGGINKKTSEIKDVEKLRKNEKQWKYVAPMPISTIKGNAVAFGDSIYIFIDRRLVDLKPNVYVYCISTNKWTEGQSMTAAYKDGFCVESIGDKIFVVGVEYTGDWSVHCLNLKKPNAWTKLSCTIPKFIWTQMNSSNVAGDNIYVCCRANSNITIMAIDTVNGRAEVKWDETKAKPKNTPLSWFSSSNSKQTGRWTKS